MQEKVYTQGESPRADAHSQHSPNGHQTHSGAAPSGDAPTYTFSRFNRRNDNTPKAARMNGREIVALLEKRTLRDEKDGPMFSGASYPPGVKRGNEGVSFVSLAILDFDGGAPLDAIETGVSALNSGDGAAAFLYTTHSHAPDAGALKYRLVLPLLEPVAGSDWPDVWARLALAFEGAPDRAAKDAPRMHYLPSCPKGKAAFAQFRELPGAPLDVATLPELPPDAPRAPYSAPESRGGDNYARRAFEGEIGRLCATASNRNDALNCTARRLGRFVGAGRLDRSEVEEALSRASGGNGYTAKDGEGAARATIKSGLDAGEREPNRKGEPTTVSSPFVSSDSSDRAPGADGDEKPRFELFSLDDLELLPRPEWIVQNILVEGTTSIISADSGSFKSFVALDLALSIATGTPFHGRDVKPGNVVYVAAEGFWTLRDRATAWLMEHGLGRPQNFHILRAPIEVANVATVHAFADQLAKFAPALIVLDTLSQCALGLNENSNDEMARFVAGMMFLGTRSAAHVMAVHHNAKAGGFRGASAIHANVDARISLERPEGDETNTVFVRCEKQRGKPFAPFALRGEEVVLPYADEYGDEITSLVFQISIAGDIPTAKRHPNAKKADTTRERLLEIFDEIEAEHGGVKVGSWKAKVEEAEIPKCGNSTFWAYRNKLESEGIIEFFDYHNGSQLFRRAGKSSPTPTTPTTPELEQSGVVGVNSNNSNYPLGVGVVGVTNQSGLPELKTPTPRKKRASNATADSEPYGAPLDAPDEIREGAL